MTPHPNHLQDSGAGHPDQMIRAHNGMSLADRFDASYIPEPNSGCWLWLGTMGFPLGVPRPRINNQRKILSGHRVSFELHKGPIPAGLGVLHTCHNTYCVNPDHLYAGTAKQNTADMMRAGRHFSQNNPQALAALVERLKKITTARRQAQTHCKRGHPLSGDNLILNGTWRVCRACRRVYRRGGYDQ